MSYPPIRNLNVRGVELPLARPVRTAVGAMATTPLALLDIRDTEGVVGRSYLRTYTPLALGALVRLLEDLAPLLVGLSGPASSVADGLRARFALLGTRGLVGMALAGVDMALWDLDARRAGMPLAKLLGARRERVAAYRPLIAVDPSPAADEAQCARAGGFAAVKVKLGHGSLERDLDVVRALAPRDGAVMVDYNQSLARADALARCRALDGEGLGWIEEPLDARDLTGLAALRAELSTPLAGGENLEAAGEVEQALALGALDVVTLDAARIGGVSGWMQAVSGISAESLPVCSHAFPEFSAHLLAASPTGRWLEYQDYVAPILAEPLRVSGGWADVPPRAGAGLEWDETVLARLL